MDSADPVPDWSTRVTTFATTHWGTVLSARDEKSPQATEALDKLCRTYWYPLYAYVRRRGYDAHDAQDLTQEFFFRLLEKNYLSQVDPTKGKFRSYLLVAISHFLANEWDRAKAVKRGGRLTFVTLDDTAEERYRQELSADGSPEKVFEQRWALTLLEQALGRLRDEFVKAGNADQFDVLKVFLTGEKPSLRYAALASQMGTTEAALKMTVQRLRQRFGRILRDEIAHTVSRPEEVDEELRFLFSAVRS